MIVGENDEPFQAGSSYMASKIAGAQLVVIDGAGHSPNVTIVSSSTLRSSEFLAGLEVDEQRCVTHVGDVWGRAAASIGADSWPSALHLPFYDRLTHGPDSRSAEKIEERLTGRSAARRLGQRRPAGQPHGAGIAGARQRSSRASAIERRAQGSPCPTPVTSTRTPSCRQKRARRACGG